MANRTDPLVNSVSGSDPQNCMEYITRQRLYDCRYWKEECFGLTVTDVLEKAVKQVKCLGALPHTTFLSLALKLLQLSAEHDIVYAAFIDQDEFKYARALGAFYIRLTSSPTEIYETLEPLYSDYRKLRLYNSNNNSFSIITMDAFIHQLLTSVAVLSITLPRLPPRRALQDAGYLPEGPRPTALRDVLIQYQEPQQQNNDNDDDPVDEAIFYNSVLRYLKHKAITEKNPAAILAWKKRNPHQADEKEEFEDRDAKEKKRSASKRSKDSYKNESDLESGEEIDRESDSKRKERKEKKKKKKKERNYDNLFKPKGEKDKKAKAKSSSIENKEAPPEEGSDEYWNEQRAKLGLKPLK